MMDIAIPKKQLRQTLCSLVKNISREHKIDAGLRVRDHIAQFFHKRSFIGSNIKVGTFNSFSDEIDTDPLNHFLFEQNFSRALPFKSETGALSFAMIDSNTPISPSLFNSQGFFAESLGPTQLESASYLDIIFAPGLAFDKQGHRLGRGKGYYDRLLSTVTQGGPIVVGLCLDQQVIADVPWQAHDVKMDYLCTPRLGIKKTANETGNA